MEKVFTYTAVYSPIEGFFIFPHMISTKFISATIKPYKTSQSIPLYPVAGVRFRLRSQISFSALPQLPVMPGCPRGCEPHDHFTALGPLSQIQLTCRKSYTRATLQPNTYMTMACGKCSQLPVCPTMPSSRQSRCRTYPKALYPILGWIVWYLAGSFLRYTFWILALYQLWGQ